MEGEVDTLIEAYIKSLRKIELSNFARFKLEILFSLRRVRIEWNFLRAASMFWDSEFHVFRFGKAEICPTIEEFQALLGHDGRGEVIFPVLQHGYVKSFCQLFNLSNEEGRVFIDGNYIHLPRLLSHFNSHEDKSSLVVRYTKENALIIALLARYLIIRKVGYGDIRLPTLINPLKDGGDLIPLVLAETLNGLDTVHENILSDFIGSPLLLQMWLFDRLKFSKVPECLNYQPKMYLRRGRLYTPNVSIQVWFGELDRVNEDSIAWHIKWWVCQEPRLESWDRCCFCFAGLYDTSFIYPSRIMRQFGVEQDVPILNKTSFPKQWLSPSLISQIKQSWYCNRRGITSRKTFITMPTDAYRVWYSQEIAPREIDRATRRFQLVFSNARLLTPGGETGSSEGSYVSKRGMGKKRKGDD